MITLKEPPLYVASPGETQDNHEELMQFVNDMEFDRLGALRIPRRRAQRQLQCLTR